MKYFFFILVNFIAQKMSQTEYYRYRMAQRNIAYELLEYRINTSNTSITGKKRKYKEAMGYQHDYEVVQETETFLIHKIKNQGDNWIDSYLENQYKNQYK